MQVHNMVESGFICSAVPTGLYPGGVKKGELVHTSQSHQSVVKTEQLCRVW